MSGRSINDPELAREVFMNDRARVFHSWSAQALIKPMALAAAEGVYLYDYEGNRYLDFASQLVNVNIGHQHPKVVAAIQRQAAEMCTISPHYAVAVRNEAARLIIELAPDRLNRVFFTNAGAEAIEHATRLARLHTGRIKVLSTYRSYHGSTTTSINLTGDPRRWPNDYGSAGVVHFFGPFLYRSPFHSSSEEEERAGARTPARRDRLRRARHDRGGRSRDDPGHRRDHAASTWLSRRGT